MSAKHTPGPWHAWHLDNAGRCFVSGANGLPSVASVHAWGGIKPEEQPANARLIAAAPELLAALKTMLEHYRTDGCPKPDCGICKRSNEAMHLAYTTIAKAEGNES